MNFGQFGAKSAEERALEQFLEQKQMRDFLKMYANLVDRCFTDCCTDFTSSKLSSKEVPSSFRRSRSPIFKAARLTAVRPSIIPGNVHHAMHRKVLETLGAGGPTIRRT